MKRNPIFSALSSDPVEISAVRRHVLCPHYDACLDEAVRRDQSFECSQCSYMLQNISIYLIHDGEAA